MAIEISIDIVVIPLFETAVPSVWQDEALCHPDHIPDWLPRQSFFATGKRRVLVDGIRMDGDRLVAAAKAVCSVCPAQYECFAHAVTEQEADGIWGGAPIELIKKWRRKSLADLFDMIDEAAYYQEPIQDAAQEALTCSSSTPTVTAPTTSVPTAISPKTRSSSRSSSPLKKVASLM